MHRTGATAKLFLCAEHRNEAGAASTAPRRRPDGTLVNGGRGRPRSDEHTDGAASVVSAGGKRGLSTASPVPAAPLPPDADTKVSKRARTNASGRQLPTYSTVNAALAPAPQATAGEAPHAEARDPALCAVTDETLKDEAATSAVADETLEDEAAKLVSS